MKLYIAGPMTGLPEFNYPAFDAAEVRLRDKGFEVLNPTSAEVHNPTPGVPQAWDWYMRHALRLVLEADGVAQLRGWGESKGATLETAVARSLGLVVLPLEDWLGG